MAGIRDVARLAGVSPSTVSRVMNGTAHVEEDKKQKVLAAIQETGFKPNELARALFKQSSKIIGVIVPNIENPFFNELAKAVEEEAYRNGYKILLCNSNNNTEKELLNIQMLGRMKADGVIIVTAWRWQTARYRLSYWTVSLRTAARLPMWNPIIIRADRWPWSI